MEFALTKIFGTKQKGFGTYDQQFALFFLLATWLSFLSQFILIGAVFNKMRLGVPRDEGIVAASPSESRGHKEPAEAIDEEKNESRESQNTGGGITPTRRRPGTG